MSLDLTQFGGRRRYLGNIDAWDFGWIPPDDRDREQYACHAEAVGRMPAFAISGVGDDPRKVCHWDCWAHPSVQAATGGKVFPGFQQITGSCVGAGGGNAVFSLSAIEVVRLHDPEQALIPFWPIPYGRSRYRAGMRGRGEGSMGSTFAEAMREDGIVPFGMPLLPPYHNSNEGGLVVGREVELEWSDGGRISPDWLTQSRKHLIRSTAPIRSADELREAIRNWYPCSWAGDWGGMMECRTAGTPAVLLNERRGVWNHQQSVHGWWDHPELGELFYVLNQWSQRAHGICPSGAPPGGYWIRKKDADYQCRTGEVFAFSQFEGFPAQVVDWRH